MRQAFSLILFSTLLSPGKAQMRKVPAFAFGFVMFGALALSSTSTMAKDVSISGTHSIGEIQQKCDAAGGDFAGGLKGGGYGCMNGGKGTSIVCENNGKCKGSVPATTKPGSIDNILRGGAHPVSAKGDSTSTSKNPVSKGIKPISASKQPGNEKQPGALMHTNEQHSGSSHK